MGSQESFLERLKGEKEMVNISFIEKDGKYFINNIELPQDENFLREALYNMWALSGCNLSFVGKYIQKCVKEILNDLKDKGLKQKTSEFGIVFSEKEVEKLNEEDKLGLLELIIEQYVFCICMTEKYNFNPKDFPLSVEQKHNLIKQDKFFMSLIHYKILHFSDEILQMELERNKGRVC